MMGFTTVFERFTSDSSGKMRHFFFLASGVGVGVGSAAGFFFRSALGET
jgi:hypothetical protein